jgi:methyl coenzyme M reductase alpha subunit
MQDFGLYPIAMETHSGGSKTSPVVAVAKNCPTSDESPVGLRAYKDVSSHCMTVSILGF